MKRSGDRKHELTAESRRRGEEQCQIFTTETRRHGEDQEGLLEIDCFQPTRQVSGPDFSRAERSKEFWALAPATVGRAFTDHPITYDHPITRFTPTLALIKNAIRTLRATLSEIFDESAYDRFLLRTNAARSTVSYRAFTRERDAAMLKKPRCC